MPVETAADLATMFDPDEFAEAAVYAPPGAGDLAECLVIVDRGQGRQVFDAGHRDVEGSDRHLWVRRADVDTVHRGGSFTILDVDGLPTDEVYRVADLPKLDHAAALWSVALTIVDPPVP